MFDNKKILITGGTGSLGQALTKKILDFNVKTVRIFSREEFKQVEMEKNFSDSRLRFLIGDIRDKERLNRALEDIDIVIHAAALKHVPVAEYNPFEAVKTNVYGSQNLIECCLDQQVEKVLAIGTDKAVSPFNTYGGTKFLMERLFVSANYYKGKSKCDFLAVRYGNVLGSRGSIVPKFIEQCKKSEKITITDPNMTRFNITMNEAIELIFRALKEGNGGDIFVPKLKAYKVQDLLDAIVEILGVKIEQIKIPVRPGEKFHESLISHNEIRNTFESDVDYIILENEIQKQNNIVNDNLNKSNLSKEYSSDSVKLLQVDELKKILISNNLI